MNVAPDVLIIGGGPAGLSAAERLARRGIGNVLLVDREPEAGGNPRFCPHPTFGLTDFYRPMSGPSYAARWRRQVDPAQIACLTTITDIDGDAEATASTPAGETQLRPKRILLATGIRERSRPARLVSGDRPGNVLTTGALQRLIFEGTPLPFTRPLIVGTEMVSFSAALSLRDHGVRAVAMLESGEHVVMVGPGKLFARVLLHIEVLCSHRIVSVNAATDDPARLVSVTAQVAGSRRDIACDAVIFTGEFVPEAALLGNHSGLVPNTSLGPVVDQHWRTANPLIYAAGNVLRSVETAAWSAREGAAAADAIADDLGGVRSGRRIPIEVGDPIRLVVPGAIALPVTPLGPLQMQIRMARRAVGHFVLASDGAEIWSSPRLSARPERRYSITRRLPELESVAKLTLSFVEDH